jgi:hypothetical protein
MVRVLPAPVASAAVTAARDAAAVCLEAGPFSSAPDSSEAAAAEAALGQAQLPAGSWLRLPVAVPPPWLVYAGRLPDPAVRAARVEELRRRGLEFEMIEAPPDWPRGWCSHAMPTARRPSRARCAGGAGSQPAAAQPACDSAGRAAGAPPLAAGTACQRRTAGPPGFVASRGAGRAGWWFQALRRPAPEPPHSGCQQQQPGRRHRPTTATAVRSRRRGRGRRRRRGAGIADHRDLLGCQGTPPASVVDSCTLSSPASAGVKAAVSALVAVVKPVAAVVLPDSDQA